MFLETVETRNFVKDESKSIKKSLPILLAGMILLSFLSFAQPVNADSVSFNQLSITINIQPSDFDSFMIWIQQYSAFHNFTFWLTNYNDFNSSQLTALTKLGEVIPTFSYTYAYPISDRTVFLDDATSFFGSHNISFDGMMQFQMDSWLYNEARSLGLNYSIGYCFDDYLIDWVTTLGGIQMPYYASPFDSLIPHDSSGILVLPFLTWDYVDSFEIDQRYVSHPMDNVASNITDYVIKFQEAVFEDSKPIGYFAFNFEYGWLLDQNKLENAGALLDYFINVVECEKYSLSNFTKWFRNNYDDTPVYEITFVSPNSGKTLEFYSSKDYRIQRIGGKIVDYINYTNQVEDYFLTGYFAINWSDPSSLKNSFYHSLNYEINALGGAFNRAPVNSSEALTYSGELADFPMYYLTYSVEQEAFMNQIIISVSIGGILAVIITLISIVYITKRRKIVKRNLSRK